MVFRISATRITAYNEELNVSVIGPLQRPRTTWRMFRYLLLFSLLLSVSAGCAGHRAAMTDLARTELIGKTKAEILACAGAPAHSAVSGNTEVLSYSYIGEKTRNEHGTKKSQCVANFILVGGRVTQLNYTGTPGVLATQGEQCGFVVSGCVR